jgi:hypothetical protein
MASSEARGERETGLPVPGLADAVQKLQTELPAILSFAKTVDAEYRSALFSCLVQHVLGFTPAPAASRQHPQGALTTESILRTDGNTAVERFCKSNSIDVDSLANVLDPDTGEILVTDLGRTTAEVERKIAALLAFSNLVKSGRLTVSRESLSATCKRFNAYDVSNFAGIIRDTSHSGATVFIRDGSDWTVSKPGERYVADVIRELITRTGK